jgi:hypothetical protein
MLRVVNMYIESSMMKKKRFLSLELAGEISKSESKDVNALKAMSLIESNKPDHRAAKFAFVSKQGKKKDVCRRNSVSSIL